MNAQDKENDLVEFKGFFGNMSFPSMLKIERGSMISNSQWCGLHQCHLL